MISDHLNDKTTCEMVKSNFDAKVATRIPKILDKYKTYLTTKEKEYLISFI